MDIDKLKPGMNREQYNTLIQECGYDTKAAWDSETNQKAMRNMPKVFRHPSAADSDTSSAYYAVTVTGPGTAFDKFHVSTFTDMKGWVATTVMIVESRSREPWTKPIDIRYAQDATVPRFGGFTKGGALVLTCNGAVHFVHEATMPDQLRALITRDQSDSMSIVGIPFRY